MPEWKGDVRRILIDIDHHVDDHKAGLMLQGEASQTALEMTQYQFKRIKIETAAVREQIEKIRKTAEEKGYSDILALLDETLSYSFDLTQLKG